MNIDGCPLGPMSESRWSIQSMRVKDRKKKNGRATVPFPFDRHISAGPSRTPHRSPFLSPLIQVYEPASG